LVDSLEYGQSLTRGRYAAASEVTFGPCNRVSGQGPAALAAATAGRRPVGIAVSKLNQMGLGNAGNLKNQVGWLFGATDASPRNVLRWRLEVELPF
jgi:hypothetical protein